MIRYDTGFAHDPPDRMTQRIRVLPLHTAREIGPLLDLAGHPELAGRFGFGPDVLDDPNALVPLPQLHDLIEAAVEASGDPYLLLHFGAGTLAHMKGREAPLLQLMRHSPDLRTGFERLLAHQRLWNPGEGYVLDERGETGRLRYLPWGPPRDAQRQMAEKTAVQFLVMLRVLAGVEPTAIRFPYAECGRSAELGRVLGLPPEFGAETTEVDFPAAALDEPTRDAEPMLYRALDRHMEKVAGRGVDRTEAAWRVRTIVAQELAGGVPSLDTLARRIGCGARSLQRQLAREGTSLRAIVEEVRRHRIEGLLASGHSVKEMAHQLGYSDATAFQHAFRRWYGMSPAQLARQQRAGTFVKKSRTGSENSTS